MADLSSGMTWECDVKRGTTFSLAYLPEAVAVDIITSAEGMQITQKQHGGISNVTKISSLRKTAKAKADELSSIAVQIKACAATYLNETICSKVEWLCFAPVH